MSENAISRLPRILLITTGGTIAMTPDATGGVTPTLTGEDLVRSVPPIADHCRLEVLSFISKPGASLNWNDLLGLAKVINDKLDNGDFDGVVVVQGTDTIEETSYLFDLLIYSDKPVIITGAMRSAMMISADGPANLLGAVIAAGSEKMRGMGTLVVLNNEIHAARYVQKSHTGHVHTFVSPGFGPLACIMEDRIYQYASISRTPSLPLPELDDMAGVALIKASLADDERILKKILRLGYQGIVIEAMGAGHLPSHYAEHISELSKRVPVILSTRVPSGPIFSHSYSFVGSEMDSLQRGAISAGVLGSLRARILLSLLLSLDYSQEQIKEAFKNRALF
jgi:L-asparaginase